MLVNFILIIAIGLIKLSYQNLSINTVYPLTIKINKEKLENISMSIILNQEIENREKARILLTYKNNTVYYESGKDQDKYNKRKIEFIINPNIFINLYGKYILYFKLNGETIEFNQTIFIYNNDIILKNPKDKYELTENIINTRIIKYEFQNEIFPEEINRIIYYSLSNSNNKYYLENYSIEDKTKLIIKFPGTSQVTTYVFDIYPEYDINSSNPEIHRFYLHFHNYLLKNDAIYINKGISNSNTVSFKTLLKQYYTFSPFIISDSNKNINCDKFSCNKNNNDNYYLCECSLNFELKSSPSIINILYENNQLRELYLILYTSYMNKCYDKDDNKNLEISMEWVEEMEYDHYLYFNDTSQKILTRNYLGKTNRVISYKYYISALSLSSGIFTLRSSIPSLNYTDYNLVDDKNLYIYIYPNNQLVNEINSFIYSHNNSKQIVNLTFNEPGGAEVLDEIILKNENTIIKVSKTEGQCTKDDTSFICDLKDIIYNYDDDKNGIYYIYYKSICDKELKIEGRTVELKKGISLESISPSWISKSIVNGSNLSLEYNDNMENKNLIIFLYTNDRSELSLPYYPVSIKNKNVIITLRNMNKGFYHIYTLINNGENKIYVDDLGFKISEQIKFEFNHHYFVLNNNGEKGKNNLIIKVNDNIEEFGCKIIEDSNKYNLININNCLEFRYPITKLGTIKFSYYDKDNFIIPINNNITVVQYYTHLFSFNSLKYCYYQDFDISINIIDFYKNKFSLLIFLKSIDNTTIFIFSNKNENIYSLVSKNNNLINKNYYLYISENIFDQEVFLYKSDNYIQFTNITVPEFIIEPNTTITFSNVKCDLSKSKFIIKKYENNNLIDKTLTSCKYNDSYMQLSCNILGTFYSSNRYKYYYYQVDEKNISDIHDSENVFLTFASKKLNEASFNIAKKKIGITGYSIIIQNDDKDFYFPLLNSLNYTIYNGGNGKNQTYIKKREDDDFEINNEEGKVELNITIELNSMLYINFLYREEKKWETISDKSTLYHYFDFYIENKLFDIEPSIYAYSNITGREFPVTIYIYGETSNNIKYINLIDCNKTNNRKCIDLSKLNIGHSQNYSISLKKENNSASKIIKFIYYKLFNNNLEQCFNNLENIILKIDTPDNLLSNKIKLEGPIIYKRVSSNNPIIYNLTITDISFQYETLTLYIDDENFYEYFTLHDLGLNIIPKYNIYLENNGKYIYLLPEKIKKFKYIYQLKIMEI